MTIAVTGALTHAVSGTIGRLAGSRAARLAAHGRRTACAALLTWLAVTTLALAGALLPAQPARAQDTQKAADAGTTQGDSQGDAQDDAGTDAPANPTLAPPSPSGYDSQVVNGQPFFLLSDASFGSNQLAQVRLEAPGREFRSELEAYGGADIVVYRVPHPLAFLKAQKNLHRLNIAPNYQGEGLANTLAYLWDRWFTEARRAWQRVLSFATRSKATEAQPQFKLGEQPGQPTRFEQNPRFAPLKGYALVAHFRYPIWDAKPIQPPAGTRLAGSSSNFIEPHAGNVMIPVGKLPPGLYLVEAIIGNYRAHTLLFVSDTVAVVKAASSGLLVWTARRDDGKPVADTQISWTDGVGVLQSGATGADGALLLPHVSPERSYVIGGDPAGGVFVSENFYYDSEIYNTKIYAVTDRPLYRPGDTVHVKFIGRAFHSATESAPAAAADLKLAVLDANGAPIATDTVHFTPDAGGEASFALPSTATGGGYTLRFDYNGDTYGSAFRVADYVKPHFDVHLTMDKTDYATGEALKGRIELRYPDGKPVKNGKISVTLRAQRVAMVDGELRYSGLFPVKLEQQELQTDGDGNATLALPAAQQPSRYALTLFAQDGAAWRVRVTREVLIARGMTPYRLGAPTTFSQPKQAVEFTLDAQAANGNNTDAGAANTANAAATDAASTSSSAAANAHRPATWEWVRLESQTRAQGKLDAAPDKGPLRFPVTFDEPGSYTLSVKDAAGNLLAATSHWVAGDGLKALPGSVEIVFDRARYQPGDTAEALITFPQPVDDALLTLERDRVEARALLSKGADWLQLTRVAPAQWKARIKVGPNFAPNLTFSVLYVHDGQYAFANAGIVVAQPSIALAVKSDKAVYGPGDTVTLDLTSTLGGKPEPANLTVSVVDEMVYVLQPEIAPNIVDFFYHPRRNNVRTSSSLSFVTYDLATSALRGAPGGAPRGQYNERGVKVLERPRRDDIDTAAWQTNLQTDANGHVRMTFRMPDALARWRVTVRAAAPDGMVGQRTAYVRSDKPLYLKWSGPTRFRAADEPVVDMIAFNQGAADVNAQWVVNGGGVAIDRTVTLKPGANYLQLPGGALKPGVVEAALRLGGKDVDRLQTPIALDADGWLDLHEIPLALDASPKPLTLPADARNLRVRLMSGAASRFARVADDLIAYPYGCTEQTASRLIPLALAHDALGAGTAGNDAATAQALDTQLRNQRQRLALLAGVNGTFGWWGDAAGGSALLTAYAYYADWLASRSLGITLPDGNWQRTLEVYRDHGADEPLLHRALALWLMQQMGQPVATQLGGVADALARVEADDLKPAASAQGAAGTAAGANGGASGAGAAKPVGANAGTRDKADPTRADHPANPFSPTDSVIFAEPDTPRGRRMATVLVAALARGSGATLPDGFDALAGAARAALASDATPLVQSLLAMTGGAQAGQIDTDALLNASSADYPTFDRALTLLWLRKAAGPAAGPATTAAASQPLPALHGDGWHAFTTPTGASAWQWSGAALPTALDIGAARPDLSALVSYESREAEPSRLPVTLERHLYRLDPVAPDNAGKDKNKAQQQAGHFSFAAHRVAPDETIDSNALYVDEVVLTPREGSAFHYGVLDVPLPPGGSVEATSWGISIDGLPGPPTQGGSGPQPFLRAARWEMGELSYHQPVPVLDRPLVLRQLVRFALPGHFNLPPVRYFRMYQPDAKAFEGGSSDRRIGMKIE